MNFADTTGRTGARHRRLWAKPDIPLSLNRTFLGFIAGLFLPAFTVSLVFAGAFGGLAYAHLILGAVLLYAMPLAFIIGLPIVVMLRRRFAPRFGIVVPAAFLIGSSPALLAPVGGHGILAFALFSAAFATTSGIIFWAVANAPSRRNG